MSAIDALIKQHLDYTCKEANKDDCAFVKDVVQLRTRAAEADALRAEAQRQDGIIVQRTEEALELRAKLSELYAAINRDGGHAEREDPDVFAHTIEYVTNLITYSEDITDSNREQAETIETLRAESQRRLEDLQAAEKKYTELRATVAAQAQTIETARDTIDKLVMRIKKFVDDNELDLWDAETLPEIISARAWLAANAPTPTTGETEYINAFAAIDKVMTEHPELFANDGAQSETESDIA